MLGAFISVQDEYNKTNSLKIDGFMQEQLKFNQSSTQAINDLKTSMARVESHLSVREKGTLPAQPLPNPRTQFEIQDLSSFSQNTEHVQAITTLRSGKTIDKSNPVKAPKPNDPKITNKDDISNNTPHEKEPERQYKPVAPFPQRLISPKPLDKNLKILEVFKQVKINIPLLDAIKQIPSYAKFL